MGTLGSISSFPWTGRLSGAGRLSGQPGDVRLRRRLAPPGPSGPGWWAVWPSGRARRGPLVAPGRLAVPVRALPHFGLSWPSRTSRSEAQDFFVGGCFLSSTHVRIEVPMRRKRITELQEYNSPNNNFHDSSFEF